VGGALPANAAAGIKAGVFEEMIHDLPARALSLAALEGEGFGADGGGNTGLPAP